MRPEYGGERQRTGVDNQTFLFRQGRPRGGGTAGVTETEENTGFNLSTDTESVLSQFLTAFEDLVGTAVHRGGPTEV